MKLTCAQRQALVQGFAYSGHTRKRLIEMGYAEDSAVHSSRPSAYHSVRYHLVATETGLEAVRKS